MWVVGYVLPLLVSVTLGGKENLCDNGWYNIHVDLPDRISYTCLGKHWPFPSQGVPSVVTQYHLKLGGVAFLYHPCVHPMLKEALSHFARSCVSKHIITPHLNLTAERPLALVTWCSTLEISHIDLCEIRHWLEINLKAEETNIDGSYQYMILRPSSVLENHQKTICQKSCYQKIRDKLKRRRRGSNKYSSVILPITPVPNGTATIFKSTGAVEPSVVNITNSSAKERYTSLASAAFVSTPTSAVRVSLTQPLNQTQWEKTTTGDSRGSRDLETPVLVPVKNKTSFINILEGVNEMNRSQSNNSMNFAKKDGDRHTELTPPIGQEIIGSSSTPKINQTQLLTGINLGPLSTSTLKPSEADIEGKRKCNCKQEPTQQPSAAALKAPGASQRKNSDVYISTPRTEEATWAASCLIFLLVLLTLAVLYTQIYKKFRKSQSLYWPSEGISAEMETVASVIKRRLLQGHTKRKKWIKRKKTPVVLYESLSESSD
ncbi:hypothetical protein GDO86_002923 [Hymenochirus boettgeri]|uniref:Tumor protein p53-inducible protein 13 n=1 Tax=Hymenochirus boettgeri TaxID=247094 RepID=A0A8T2K4Y5_9PIPI|nr:hypothetical protein GDO86_002923 [Hymenochirus boettgeri]